MIRSAAVQVSEVYFHLSQWMRWRTKTSAVPSAKLLHFWPVAAVSSATGTIQKDRLMTVTTQS